MKLPKVTLKTGESTLQIPESFLGKWTVLYFYPKDDTPGCTKQACNYRDNLDAFEDLGVNVYGVSADDLDSHGSFKSKFKLNFPLISDPDYVLCEALKVNSGKSISRDTFVVNSKGEVVKEWRKVKPDTTVEETLSYLNEVM